jgi:hypothetical protein
MPTLNLVTQLTTDLAAIQLYVETLERENTRLADDKAALKQRIAHSVAELRDLAMRETITAEDVYTVANRLQQSPKAPSIPRQVLS